MAVQYQIPMCTSRYAKLHIVAHCTIAPCTNILRTPLNLSQFGHIYFPQCSRSISFSFSLAVVYCYQARVSEYFMNRGPTPPSEQQDQYCSHQELENTKLSFFDTNSQRKMKKKEYFCGKSSINFGMTIKATLPPRTPFQRPRQ